MSDNIMTFDMCQLGLSDAVYCCVTEKNAQVLMINLDDISIFEIRYMSIDEIEAMAKDHTCIFIEIRKREVIEF